jgi:hypothetical protein
MRVNVAIKAEQTIKRMGQAGLSTSGVKAAEFAGKSSDLGSEAIQRQSAYGDLDVPEAKWLRTLER